MKRILFLKKIIPKVSWINSIVLIKWFLIPKNTILDQPNCFQKKGTFTSPRKEQEGENPHPCYKGAGVDYTGIDCLGRTFPLLEVNHIRTTHITGSTYQYSKLPLNLMPLDSKTKWPTKKTKFKFFFRFKFTVFHCSF